jgi:hypothetical protein
MMDSTPITSDRDDLLIMAVGMAIQATDITIGMTAYALLDRLVAAPTREEREHLAEELRSAPGAWTAEIARLAASNSLPTRLFLERYAPVND